jgi:hypothetical protein
MWVRSKKTMTMKRSAKRSARFVLKHCVVNRPQWVVAVAAAVERGQAV